MSMSPQFLGMSGRHAEATAWKVGHMQCSDSGHWQHGVSAQVHTIKCETWKMAPFGTLCSNCKHCHHLEILSCLGDEMRRNAQHVLQLPVLAQPFPRLSGQCGQTKDRVDFPDTWHEVLCGANEQNREKIWGRNLILK